MDNSQILLAVAVVAALALIGRLLINRNKNKKTSWRKLTLIFAAVAAYMLVFMIVDPYAARIWWAGEASLADGSTENIAGRKAASDIPVLLSASETNDGFYYSVQNPEATLTPTGFYRLKNLEDSQTEIERKVETSETNKQIIQRRQNLFGVTRRPSEPDRYLQVFSLAFADSSKILLAADGDDLAEMPVCILRPMDNNVARIAAQDTTLRSDSYLLAFNEHLYSSDRITNIIHRSIAGLAAAVVVAAACALALRKR